MGAGASGFNGSGVPTFVCHACELSFEDPGEDSISCPNCDSFEFVEQDSDRLADSKCALLSLPSRAPRLTSYR